MTLRTAKPAAGDRGHRTITVSNWKPMDANCLKGFLSLTISPGVILHNCQLLETAGRRWIGLPARRFVSQSGDKHYEPIVEFTSRATRREFDRAALAAVESYLKARGQW